MHTTTVLFEHTNRAHVFIRSQIYRYQLDLPVRLAFKSTCEVDPPVSGFSSSCSTFDGNYSYTHFFCFDDVCWVHLWGFVAATTCECGFLD